MELLRELYRILSISTRPTGNRTESEQPGPFRGPPANQSPAGPATRPRRVQGGTDERPRADGGRERGATRAHLRAQRGERISASLDLETVLNEVVDSARALTGARFGAIATIDEAGAPQDFVTSGFTEEEHRRLAEWSDGPRLFEHFRDLPGPVRIADLAAYQAVSKPQLRGTGPSVIPAKAGIQAGWRGADDSGRLCLAGMGF